MIIVGQKITLFMKSGSQITVRGVSAWRAEYSGNDITALKIERSFIARVFGFKKIIVGTVDLSQIEAMVVH